MGNIREGKTNLARNRMPALLACQARIAARRGRRDLERGAAQVPEEGSPARGVDPGAEPNKFLNRLLLAGVEGEFLRTNHLSVQGAANDFESTPDGALVIGLGFDEVCQRAQFRTLGVD